MKIAVIGAGASGIFAALQAAWNGADVTLFERNAEIGRKLLATGSGRCNITNAEAAAGAYTCADPGWMKTLLRNFGVSDLLAMLANLGIAVYKTSDGWYYPLSNSAASVVEILSNALFQSGVRIKNSAQATTIQANRDSFSVSYLEQEKENRQIFDRVIVSSGGKAYPTLGSRGELFPVLKKLGHTVLPLRPALAPLLVDIKKLPKIEGMRLDVGVALWKDNQKLAASKGNLIFTPWGLNGPAVMNVSHQASAFEGQPLELSLNVLAYIQEDYDLMLSKKRSSLTPVHVFLAMFFNPKVANSLMQYLKLPRDATLDGLNGSALKKITAALQDIRLPVKGTRDFEYCQISAGGVPVSEASPQTLESLIVKGLYLTGETLDVVGPCGGYNLQFAFSSGALAGLAASSS